MVTGVSKSSPSSRSEPDRKTEQDRKPAPKTATKSPTTETKEADDARRDAPTREDRRPTAASSREARLVRDYEPSQRLLRERLERQVDRPADIRTEETRQATLRRNYGLSSPPGSAPARGDALRQTLEGTALVGRSQFRALVSSQTTHLLNNPARPAQQQPTLQGQDLIDALVERGKRGTRALASALRDPSVPPEARGEAMAAILKSGDADQIAQAMLAYGGVDDDLTLMNAETLSSAIGEAWTQGDLTAADLPAILEELGPERSEALIALVAMDPDNTSVGGIADGLGSAAADLAATTTGDDSEAWARASTLAFASSTELMEARIPPSERQAAFDRIWGQREDWEKAALLQGAPNGSFGQGALAFVPETLAAAFRLSTGSAGFDAAERREILEQLGPEASRELAFRLTDAGDGGVGGPLEQLGRAASAQSTQNASQRDDWRLTRDIAYALSPDLIEKYFGGNPVPVFNRLNEYLASREDTAWDHYGASQVHRESRIVSEALGRLFEAETETILDEYLVDGMEQLDKIQDLVGLFERTLFSPHASDETRTRIEDALAAYVATKTTQPGLDAAQVGADIGHLYAAMQAAAENAVENASERGGDAAFAGQVMSRMFGKLAAHFAKSMGPAGPFIGMAAESVLRELIDPSVSDAAIEDGLARAFLDYLEANGGNIHAARDFMLAVNDLYEARMLDLNQQLEDPSLTPDERAELEETRIRLMQLYGSLNDGFLIFTADDRL